MQMANKNWRNPKDFSKKVLSLASVWDKIKKSIQTPLLTLSGHSPTTRKELFMDHIQNFNSRLIGIFETKAEEFTKFSLENPSTAPVAAQLASLYSDLVALMKN